MHITHRVVLASLLGLTLVASAATLLKIDPAKTSVSAVFKQMSVPVETKFKKYTIAIDYNPAKPELATASVEVETASLDFGDADYNKEIAKKEWFNSVQFPKATFVSSSIKPAGPGKLTVLGKLTIKGKSVDVSFPLSVTTDGTKQIFDGALPIKRLTFNVGEGEWKDSSIVADEVTIKFHVNTAP